MRRIQIVLQFEQTKQGDALSHFLALAAAKMAICTAIHFPTTIFYNASLAKLLGSAGACVPGWRAACSWCLAVPSSWSPGALCCSGFSPCCVQVLDWTRTHWSVSFLSCQHVKNRKYFQVSCVPPQWYFLEGHCWLSMCLLPMQPFLLLYEVFSGSCS